MEDRSLIKPYAPLDRTFDAINYFMIGPAIDAVKRIFEPKNTVYCAQCGEDLRKYGGGEFSKTHKAVYCPPNEKDCITRTEKKNGEQLYYHFFPLSRLVKFLEWGYIQPDQNNQK